MTIASSRLRNSGLKIRSIAALERLAGVFASSEKPIDGSAHLARAGVGRQDQHGVAEVGFPAGVVGERGVVHHLQQDVVDVGMRLLELVEEHHAVRVRADRVDQQAALLEADVAGRRADQPRDRVLLHVLAHVEADEFVAELQRELLRQLGLADPGRPGEQEAARGALGRAQAGARPLDGLGDQVDRLVLAEHHALERFFERPQPFAIGRRRLPRGDARHARRDRLDIRRLDRQRVGRAGILQADDGARFVDEIDRAVGQADVAQVARGELRCRVERRVRVLDAVVRFVAAAQAGEDPHGLFGRRLVDDDFLQAAGERAVLLDLLELLEGRRADDAELAAGQQRLHHRRQVHRAASHRAGADGGMNLVDEEDRPAAAPTAP